MEQQVDQSESERDFSISVFDALHYIKSAWDMVTKATIANCFRHAGFVERDGPPSDPEIENNILKDLVPVDITAAA